MGAQDRLAAAEGKGAEDAETIEKHLKAAQEAEAQLAKAREELEEVQGELLKVREEARHTQEKLAEEKAALELEVQSLREAVPEAKELDEAREAAQQLEEKVVELEEAKKAVQELAQRIAELEEAEEAAQKLEEMAAELEESKKAVQELAQRVAELEEAQEAAQKLEEKLEESEARANAADAKAATLDEQVGALVHKLAERDRDLEKAAEAAHEHNHERRERDAELRAQLEEAEKLANARASEIEQLSQQLQDSDALLDQAKVDFAAVEKRALHAEYLNAKFGISEDGPAPADPHQAIPAEHTSGTASLLDLSPHLGHDLHVQHGDVPHIVHRGLPDLTADGEDLESPGHRVSHAGESGGDLGHELLEEGLLDEAIHRNGQEGTASLDPSPIQSPESIKYRVVPPNSHTGSCTYTFKISTTRS